jgi:hypothetical protein
MSVRPEEEIGPQLRSMGIMKQDVRTLVLTHFLPDPEWQIPQAGCPAGELCLFYDAYVW